MATLSAVNRFVGCLATNFLFHDVSSVLYASSFGYLLLGDTGRVEIGKSSLKDSLSHYLGSQWPQWYQLHPSEPGNSHAQQLLEILICMVALSGSYSQNMMEKSDLSTFYLRSLALQRDSFRVTF